MADFGSALWNKPTSGDTGEGSGGASDPVTRSLRFDGSAYLSRSTGSTSTTWTLSFWVKRATISGPSQAQYLATWGISGSAGEGISFRGTTDSSNTDKLGFWNGSTTTYSSGVYRDPSAWANICISVNSGTATVYYNGESILSGITGVQAWGSIRLGAWLNQNELEGMMADVYGVEGSALDHTSFTESNSYGGLKPKAYTGSFGTNGFHIDAQPAHDADLLVTSVGRNDGDTTFVDVAAGHTITKTGTPQHKNTVGNPFDSSGTAMYFSGSSDSVKTTASSDFAFGTGDFTMEGWWYFNTISSSSDAIIVDLRPANDSTTTAFSWSTNTNNGLKIYRNGSSALGGSLSTETWHHLALVRSSGTVTVYIDGVPSATTLDWSSVDLTTNGTPRLGAAEGGGSVNLDGYVFDVRITKGTARYTSNFSSSLQSAPFELNPVYIGGDQSGNKNHFTPTTGISTTDIREDNPFKNHATWNPLIKRSSTSNIFTYSEGNTVATYTGGVAHTSTTIASTGVHYAEFAFSGGTSSISGAGVVRARWNDGSADSYTTNYGGCYYGSSGNVDSPSGSTSVSAVGSNRLGIAFDGANNKADFYSVTSGGTMTLLKSLTSSDSIDFDGSATFTATSHDTGATSITGYFEAGEWWGTAPSVGSTTASSLNTSNLAAPSIKPAEHFTAAKYEGAGGSEEINLGFTPALTWIKRRENSGYYHGLYDSVRGLSAGALASNGASNEDSTQRVASFDSDTGSEGFTLSSSHYSYTNTSGKDFISWNWKAHQGGPVTRSHTMTLEVNDLWGSATDWYNTKLEVWEGATKLADISQPAYNGGSSTTYTIKTNDTDKIKVVWDVDSSMDWTAMYAVLKNSSNTTLASWDGSSYYGGSTPADGSNFYIPSSHDSSNAATTGVVEGPTTVTESYNAAAGFSIITYSGNGSSDGDTQEITHTLGDEPEFIIAKSRSSSSSNGTWNVYHKHAEPSTSYGYGTHGYLRLDENYAANEPYYDILIPKSGSENTIINTVYNSSDGLYTNESGVDYVMYAWAGVEGYSKFGKYIGNGSSTDGPFIYTGFRPAFILIKNIGASQDWFLLDNKREGYNVVDDFLEPNTSNAEATASTNKADFTANGFKLRGSGSVTNQNNTSFVYACFSESPFKYSNAK